MHQKEIAKYWLTTYPFTDNASPAQAPVISTTIWTIFLAYKSSRMVPVVAPKSISCPNVMSVISNFQVPHFVWFLIWKPYIFHGSETIKTDHPCGATLHQLPPWQLGGLFFPKRWRPDTCLKVMKDFINMVFWLVVEPPS